MLSRACLPRWLVRPSKPAARRRRESLPTASRFRPRLELLEDRTLLSTYLVNSTGDTGTGAGLAGDLRFALTNAMSGDTIDLTGITGTIALGSSLPAINQNISLVGPGASNLTVSGNNAVGVFVINAGATVSISGLTIADGSATNGAAIFNNGTLTLDTSNVTNNTSTGAGGAIDNNGAAASLTVMASSFIGNTAGGAGGGIENNQGTVTLINTTFKGNQASTTGGGIDNALGTITIKNSTIVGNTALTQGGGVFTNGGSATLLNTIVANNFAPSATDLSGTVTANFSIVEDTTGATFTGGSGNNLNGLDPILGPLQDNGGPTPNMAPLIGSPAIDTGTTDPLVTTDQRGVARPQGLAPDMGAVENVVFTVTNTNDAGPGSLRDAIQQVNLGVGSIIEFDIPTSDPNFNPGTGAFTIKPLTSLDTITAAVEIDGYSEPGSNQNNLPNGDNAVLTIVIDGSSAPGDGLVLQGGNSFVRGLDIVHFSGAGLQLTGGGNIIAGNFIGVDVTGTTAQGNQLGISISSANNLIGASTSNSRNILSGNQLVGVDIHGSAATGNWVEGNFIGTDATGTVALGNIAGVLIEQQASGNTVGGSVAGQGNVLSGNLSQGLLIRDAGTSANLALGNLIGTDPTGTVAVGNGSWGVQIINANDNTIGGTVAADRNLLSGNSEGGVAIFGTGADNNLVESNFVGTDITGSVALANAFSGIYTGDGAGFSVLGVAAGTSILNNLVGANLNYGVWINGIGASGNLVQGNLVGTDASGTTALSNAFGGIQIQNGDHNTIGGSTPAQRNVASGNATSDGILILGANASANLVQGNYVGADITGTVAIPNAGGLIIYQGGHDNTIGGSGTGEGNLISGNVQSGLVLDGLGTSNNVILGNSLGTNAAGTGAIPNGFDGIHIQNQATFNVIGGTTAGSANTLAGNLKDGVEISGVGTNNNLVIGNFIGTSASLATTLGNAISGVAVSGGASHNTIGSSAGANTIAFTTGAGVTIGTTLADTSTGNTIVANSIFSNGGLGIDLGGDGVTPNTPGGPHVGPNSLQNFPVITEAVLSPVSTVVAGTFNSTPHQTFTLDFYANTTADPSGNGEGQTYLGSVQVNTDASGNATYSANLSALPGGESIVSATATDANGSTSEFSIAVQALAIATHFQISVPTGAAPGTSFNFTVTALDAANNPGAYLGTIQFSSTDGLAVLPADYTFTPGDNSTHTFSATLMSSGTQTIHGVDAVVRTLFGTSSAIVVAAGAPQVVANSVYFLVNNLPAPTAAATIGQPVIVGGTFQDIGASSTTFTVSIDWGDGTTPDVLHLPVNTFTFVSPVHTYSGDLTYNVAVTVTNDTTGLVSAPFIVVFNSYQLAVTDITISPPAQPGGPPAVAQTIPVIIPGTTGQLSVKATLYRDPGATDPAYIVVANVPPSQVTTLSVTVVEQIGNLIIPASFDVRTVNVDGHDVAVVTFSYILLPGFDPNAVNPVLRYFDPNTQALEDVFGSTQVVIDDQGNTPPPNSVPANRVLIDHAAQSITVTFDSTSIPTLESLKGTVFTITIAAPGSPVPQQFVIPLAALQNNQPVVTGNFISTPQLTLTLKLPQSVQTSSSPGILFQDHSVIGDGDSDERVPDHRAQSLQIITEMLQEIPIPYLSILFQQYVAPKGTAPKKVSELSLSSDDAFVGLEPIDPKTELFFEMVGGSKWESDLGVTRIDEDLSQVLLATLLAEESFTASPVPMSSIASTEGGSTAEKTSEQGADEVEVIVCNA